MLQKVSLPLLVLQVSILGAWCSALKVTAIPSDVLEAPAINIFYYNATDYAPEQFHIDSKSLQPQCFDVAVGPAVLNVCIEVDVTKPEATISAKLKVFGQEIDLGRLVVNPQQPCVHVGVDVKVLSFAADFCVNFDSSCLELKASACLPIVGCKETGRDFCWGKGLSHVPCNRPTVAT